MQNDHSPQYLQDLIAPMDEHNSTLINNVHPQNRTNPTPQDMYNLVVIGGGSAGLISAAIAAALGAKVALVEEHLMGGDCLNSGCVPSKSLIRPARLAEELRQATKFGFTPAEFAKSDFTTVMEQLRRIRAEISRMDSVERYTGLGVDVFLGHANFSGKNTITVNNATLNFRKAVIASGASPVTIPIEGLEKGDCLTNETIFNLTTLPERILFIGGGPIGCELAQAFRRLGADVTIMQNQAFLPREDAEASSILAEVFKKEGINVRLHTSITHVEKTADNKKIAFFKNTNEETSSAEFDEIFMGVGRAPNVQNMRLDVAGVNFDPRKGILVNDHLQTSNPNIYAAGDCCMNWKFTHAADAAAQIVVQNALFMGRRKLSSLIMPWCTYTEPEIAHVGMYEHEAKANNIPVDFYKYDMAENDRAIADRDSLGFVKVMTKKGSDKILGATIVAGHAGEMISEISTAMVGGVGLNSIAGTIHPYPTQASAIQKVAQQYKKTKLTPTVAKVLKWFLNYQLKKK